MASEFKNRDKFVRTYGSQVEQEMETRLKNAGKYASGTLHDSIKFEVKEENGRITLVWKMADYGEYVDKGVNGYEKKRGSKYSFKKKDGKGTGRKSKFISSLQKWCAIRGLPKGAAYPIRKNIWKFGIAPTNFFTIPATRRAKQFEKGYEKSMALDYDQLLQQEIKKVGLVRK